MRELHGSGLADGVVARGSSHRVYDEIEQPASQASRTATMTTQSLFPTHDVPPAKLHARRARRQTFRLRSAPTGHVEVPLAVRTVATLAWQGGVLPRLTHTSRYAKRALWRAALIALFVEHGPNHFPPSLSRAGRDLFRPRWQQSERGRCLKGLLSALGAASTDSPLSHWIDDASRLAWKSLNFPG